MVMKRLSGLSPANVVVGDDSNKLAGLYRLASPLETVDSGPSTRQKT
jgi:hypothetical protein